MIKRVQDNDEHEHIEASPREVKQARKGWPVLYVLLASLAGAFLVLGLTFAYFA